MKISLNISLLGKLSHVYEDPISAWSGTCFNTGARMTRTYTTVLALVVLTGGCTVSHEGFVDDSMASQVDEAAPGEDDGAGGSGQSGGDDDGPCRVGAA